MRLRQPEEANFEDRKFNLEVSGRELLCIYAGLMNLSINNAKDTVEEYLDYKFVYDPLLGDFAPNSNGLEAAIKEMLKK